MSVDLDWGGGGGGSRGLGGQHGIIPYPGTHPKKSIYTRVLRFLTTKWHKIKDIANFVFVYDYNDYNVQNCSKGGYIVRSA